MTTAVGLSSYLTSVYSLHEKYNTSYGFIDPDGKIYETAFIIHKVVAQTICASLGIETYDPLLTLERLGWVKFMGNGFFWDRQPTPEQMEAMVNYAIEKRMAEIYINSWKNKELLWKAQTQGKLMRKRMRRIR